MRKSIAILLTLAIIFSMMSVSAFAAETAHFSDMPDNWSTEALDNAVSNGLLTGYNEKIMPADNLTRAQMATIINRAFGAIEKASLSNYKDVSDDAWYYDEMAKAVQMKTFIGSGDKLNPNNNITREEAFVVLARAFKLSEATENALNRFSDKALVSQWAKDSVSYLAEAGYISGSNGKINPKQNITREEFAQIMDNLLKNYIKKAGTYTTVNTGNVMVNVPDVILKNIVIKGDLIIGDGVGNGNVTLDGVTVSGRTVIRGGGINSIRIIGDSNLQNIIIARVDGQLRVYSEDGTEIGDITVDGYDDVVIEGSAGNITVLANDVTVTTTNADITSVSIEGDNSNIIVDTNSTIGSVAINSENSGIEVSGQVSNIHTDSNAVGTDIIVTSGGQVTSIVVNSSGATVGGSGKVSKVTANADNVKVTTANTSVTAGIGTKGVIAGTTPVSGGTSVNTAPIPKSTVGSGGSSSSNDNNNNSVSVSAVSITGNAVVGQTLTATQTPSGAMVTYQWKRCDTADGIYTNITGAKASTYKLVADDTGKFIRVTAMGTGNYTGTVISAAKGPVVPELTIVDVTTTKNPAGGSVKVGETLILSVVMSDGEPAGERVEYFAVVQDSMESLDGISILEHSSSNTFIIPETYDYNGIQSIVGKYIDFGAEIKGVVNSGAAAERVGPIEAQAVSVVVDSVETSAPTTDGKGTGATNIGKYTVGTVTGTAPSFATVITGTEALVDVESANTEQGIAKWVGVIVTTDKEVTDLAVKTPSMTEYTHLGDFDVTEAVAVGATGTKAFVWWLKSEDIGSEGKDISIKVQGEEDSTAVTLKVKFNAYVPAETVDAVSIITDTDVTGGVDNNQPVTVTLSTDTEDASIYYTLNGETPTSDTTLYEESFSVTAPGISGGSVTVKAIGIKSGYTNSAIAEKQIVFKAAEEEPEEIVRGEGEVTQDPGPTGGSDIDYSFNDETKILTISNGEVPYVIGTDQTPYSGNWVGVAIKTPEGFEGDITGLTINGNTYDQPILSAEEQVRGELWYYFIAAEENATHTLVINWSAEYQPETIIIKTNGLTLEDAPVPVVEGSIERDPAGTGGTELEARVDGSTMTFNGEIEWYLEDDELGRAAGNRVGVKITAPAGLDTSAVKVTIGTTEYNWDDIEDGDDYFFWYPLITEAGQEFESTVLWNSASTQVFAVKIDESATLETALGAALEEVKEGTTITGSVSEGIVATFPDEIPSFFDDAGYKINSEIELAHDVNGTITITRGDTPLVITEGLNAGTYTYTQLVAEATSRDEPSASDFTNEIYGGQLETYSIIVSGNTEAIDTTVTIRSIISNDGFVTKTVLAELVDLELKVATDPKEVAKAAIKPSWQVGTVEEVDSEILPDGISNVEYKVTIQTEYENIEAAQASGRTVTTCFTISEGITVWYPVWEDGILTYDSSTGGEVAYGMEGHPLSEDNIEADGIVYVALDEEAGTEFTIKLVDAEWNDVVYGENTLVIELP